ncbi:hypothetical protein KC19_11G031300 [Ceratodon purpureus]|uniref:DNA-directed RNA polymerase III subunit RPC6 n=1 Tax=Ceratodon purpureus TaxID=3225 RepID=A0A8T0GCS5_CERPU|nr:hypothetical protein KC19_11G031300 [Ceratodon purpureus]
MTEGAMASELHQAIKKVMDLCRAHPDGLPQKIFEEEIPDVELLAQALNVLLEKRKLEVFSQGEYLVYKEHSRPKVADKLKGLASKELLVYQTIERAANRGIWTADLEARTNLQQPEINRALKTLERRSLIKAVRTVRSKNRKAYIVFELTPSEEVTGGALFTELEFDAAFVDVIKQECLQFIAKQKLVDLQAIADAIRKSGISKIELGLEEIKQIMDTLVLDGDVEVTTSGGKSHSTESLCYRIDKMPIPTTSALTNVPCGICPVMRDCSPGGLISPETCVYLDEWLSF